MLELLIEELKEEMGGGRRRFKFLRKLLPKNDKDRVNEVKSVVRKAIRKAKSARMWWKLSKLERGILTLVTHLQIKLKSSVLVKILLDVLKKLALLLNPMYRYYILGFEAARRACKAAYKLGNKGALSWMKDADFVIYWGMLVAGSHGLTIR